MSVYASDRQLHLGAGLDELEIEFSAHAKTGYKDLEL